MRKIFVVVPALVVALFVIHCAHMTSPPTEPMAKYPPASVVMDTTHCAGGVGIASEHGPVICIDSNSLNANPDHQHVHRGAWIHFFLTNAGQEIDIQFKEPAKVQFKERRGNECWLRIRDDALTGQARYTVFNLTTGKNRDPDVMIDP